MKTLIINGLLIDPACGIQSKLNLLLDGGKVAAVASGLPEADRVIDASGKVVAPGFVDLHMHEDPVVNGRIAVSIFNCMLSMGVTTAVGGNCGDNACDPGDYLDLADRQGLPCNVAMLAGHTWFREQAGAANKYAPATDAQIAHMARGIARALDRGCVGLSYGVRYAPGADLRELLAAAAPCKLDGKPIAAHLRDDAAAVFSAAEEMRTVAQTCGLPLEISHIGSMAGFGQMEQFLALVDSWNAQGLQVGCDCYPYSAFSTSLGSATYDDGWLDRYHCGYDVLELAEGPYKGQRCTEEIFRAQRRDFPSCVTVCYVMRDEDVERALLHPGVMLASDGTMDMGQGHPRAAGTFPRLIAEYVRTGKLSLYDAIAKMTALPAKKMGIPQKGTLRIGADGDVVIFDPETIRDNATWAQPTLAPSGIDYVLVGGEIAVEKGNVRNASLGRSVRR